MSYLCIIASYQESDRCILHINNYDSFNYFEETEDGIFCELNQRSCLTYAIPARITESDLKYLEESIVKNCLSIDDVPYSSPSSESAIETPPLLSTEFYSHINTLLFLESTSLRVPLDDNVISHISAETVSYLNCI